VKKSFYICPQKMSNQIEHYGTARHSGRYPWGSGKDPHTQNVAMYSYFQNMKRSGLSEKQVADTLGVKVEDVRQWNSTAKYNIKVAETAQAQKLKDTRMSNVAIGKEMGKDESYIRALLSEKNARDLEARHNLNEGLKKEVAKSRFVDVGAGTELTLGVNQTKLKQSLSDLEDQGYNISQFSMIQLGTGKETRRIVLSGPEDGYKEIRQNEGKIMPVGGYVEREKGTYEEIPNPIAISAKRIKIKYGDEGGTDMDGVIELRPGVDDLSLGASSYAQVRVLTDTGKYLKGMAIYNPDLPKGVDILYNTNKKSGTPPDDVFKPADINDPAHPFGSQTKPGFITDINGVKHQTALNLVNDEGDWDKWSRTLSSQFLGKQDPRIAKQQLTKREEEMNREYDEIASLTNSVVRENLMRDFAENADSQAVHMKAAPFPGQTTSVILPIPSLKENEVYAPQYNNGDKIVLVRYPHAGIFEIPECVVNNKNPVGKAMNIKRDAIGIHPKTASQLSGADFDGDTVIVIPNHDGKVKIGKPIEGLSTFDSKVYSVDVPPGKTKQGYTMNKKTRGLEMGKVSNLITDMTIKGADPSEIARAVKHSMVVIDAYKHGLDYKQSERDQNIKELRIKYQGKATGGASTLLSKASSQETVPARSPITPDKETGERRYRETGSAYKKLVPEKVPKLDIHGQPIRNAKGKIEYELTGKKVPLLDDSGAPIMIPRKMKSTKMMERKDAHELSSGSEIEEIYADHANNMKALANAARKVGYQNTPFDYNPASEKAYQDDVDRLRTKLIRAQKNAPMERAAQSVANSMVKDKKLENPDMDAEQLKKYKGIALDTARTKVGASKAIIYIEDSEWDAIQAGAINKTTLRKILQNADSTRVKELATPHTTATTSEAIASRARSLAAAGNLTRAEIATKLGVSVSTVSKLIDS
jgi:DNA-binding transcriptional regulator YiaG